MAKKRHNYYGICSYDFPMNFICSSPRCHIFGHNMSTLLKWLGALWEVWQRTFFQSLQRPCAFWIANAMRSTVLAACAKLVYITLHTRRGRGVGERKNLLRERRARRGQCNGEATT